MLTNLRDLPGSVADDADVLVVGGGAVGLCLAVDLARAGKKVVVLEAGRREVCESAQAVFASASWRGYPLEGIRAGRVRALGGTTHLWGGQLATFEPIVFEDRPWVTDSGWPIRATDLQDAYDRAYALLGLGGQVRDDEAWRRVCGEAPDGGAELSFFFTRWAREKNFARLFEADIRSSPNLCVVLDAPVAALSVGVGGRVLAATVRTADGRTREFPAARFVLANGSVEIARLLMLPAADGEPAPWSENPWLGRGFLDHVDAFAGRVTLTDTRRFHRLFDSVFIRGLKYKPKMRLSDAAQRRHELVAVNADFFFDSEFREELAVLKNFGLGVLKRRIDREVLRAMPRDPGRLAQLAGVGLPMVARYLRHRRTYNPGDRGIHLRLSTEQKPQSDSRLRLLSARDSAGQPAVEIDWRIGGDEVEAMATLADGVAGFLERTGLARVEIDERLRTRNRDFLASIDDANHHMGMARMAATPDRGVVDRDLRVFGTANLYVAGAATFPTSGSANPTLTALALGLRLAEMLRRDALPADAARRRA